MTYYPSKWCSVALPTYGIASIVVSTFIYFGMNLANTKPLDSKLLISDESTQVTPFIYGDHYDIPSAHDLPLRLVNKLMYDI